MNKAIQLAGEEMNICIPEFTVAGIPHGTFFAHKWFIGSDDAIDAKTIANLIDEKLKVLNDDYEVERRHALKAVEAVVLPEQKFMDFMNLKGKLGGQHKFPRVLKGKMLEEWERFLSKGQLTMDN